MAVQTIADYFYETTGSIFNETAEPFSEEFCKIFLFTTDVVLAGCICFFGIIGNIICLTTFSGYESTSVGSILLLLKGIACADLTYLVLYFPNQVWASIEYTRWQMNSTFILYCWAYIWPVVIIAICLSTWYMVLVGLHRYTAVIHPLTAAQYSTKSRVSKQMGIVSLLSVIFCIPIFFELTVIDVLDLETNTTYKTFEYSDIYNDKYYQIIYKNIIMLGFKKYVPMSILIFISARIIITVRKAKKERNELVREEGGCHHSSIEMKVTKTLLSIMILFIICELPGCVYPIVRVIIDVDHGYCSLYNYYGQLANTIELINAAANVVIYWKTSEAFRKELRRTCCKKKFGRGDSSLSGGNAVSRNSAIDNNYTCSTKL